MQSSQVVQLYLVAAVASGKRQVACRVVIVRLSELESLSVGWHLGGLTLVLEEPSEVDSLSCKRNCAKNIVNPEEYRRPQKVF